MRSVVRSFSSAGLLLAIVGSSILSAQHSREPVIAVSAGTVFGEYSTYGLGLSARVYSSSLLTVRIGGSYGWPLFTGATVCVEGPCDHRKFRDDRRFGVDARRSLGRTAYFAHGGLGVSWPHVIGDVAVTWNDCCGTDRRTPLGFGQLGIGHRSRNAAHGHWVEAGIEREAATHQNGIYIRVGIGIL